MKNVYCLAFHPLVLACLNINNQDYLLQNTWELAKPNFTFSLSDDLLHYL